MTKETENRMWIKPVKCSLRTAIIIFIASVILQIGGVFLSVLPFDITLHGVIGTVVGIVSLYLFQNAISNKNFTNWSPIAGFYLLYWFMAIIVAVLSNCMCEIGDIKVAIVMFMAPVIFIIMIFRTKRSKKNVETGQESHNQTPSPDSVPPSGEA